MNACVYNWYTNCCAAVDALPRDERLAGQMLVDAVRDLRLREEPDFSHALTWFSTADDTIMSLRFVCRILGVKMGRIQQLVVKMLQENCTCLHIRPCESNRQTLMLAS